MEGALNFREKVLDHLHDCGMDYRSIDFISNVNVFKKQMEEGLAGHDSTLQMIPAYIGMPVDVPCNKPVIAIDAGGTNLRVALVSFGTDKKPVISDYQNYKMPGVEKEVSCDEFFDVFAGYLKKLIISTNKIGFCFSYPVQIQPDHDGRLLYFTKEVKVKNSQGILVGANLIQSLKRAGIDRAMDIIVLNDTAATLLGGKAAYPDRVFGAYIGFILGTGTNTAYVEECANISKISGIIPSTGSMIINIESGGYGMIKQGEADIEMDKYTVDPGHYHFEKMISGRYQGELILTALKRALKVNDIEKRMFSCCFSQKIAEVEHLTATEVDEFLLYPYGNGALASCCGAIDDDRQYMFHMIDCLMERSAKLAAINLSATVVKTGKAIKPFAPVCITAEGSAFYRSKLMKPKVEYYLKNYLNETMGLYYEFVKSDNPTIIGTAIAGLS